MSDDRMGRDDKVAGEWLPVPADHGTPNTGDERDREVEALVHCVGCSDQRCEGIEDPSRDGTVAVEDVARWLQHVDRLDEINGAGLLMPHFNPLWDAAEALRAEFGVSERTERIHDQATKEEEQ